MDVNGKVWGTSSKLFSRNNVEVHRISGLKGGKSSIHCHHSKKSFFFVESGSIAVHVEKTSYELVDRTVLFPEQSMTIQPKEFHWFEVLEDETVAYEIYWVEIDPDDIERRNCGSMTK